ncbi:hypothetical protein M8C21_031937, partial [Ambrosia artemisiifolia]
MIGFSSFAKLKGLTVVFNNSAYDDEDDDDLPCDVVDFGKKEKEFGGSSCSSSYLNEEHITSSFMRCFLYPSKVRKDIWLQYDSLANPRTKTTDFWFRSEVTCPVPGRSWWLRTIVHINRFFGFAGTYVVLFL